MEPIQMEDEELLQLGHREASLGALGQDVGNESRRLLEFVDSTWGKGIEPTRLSADGESSYEKDPDHRCDDEQPNHEVRLLRRTNTESERDSAGGSSTRRQSELLRTRSCQMPMR